MGNGAWCGLGLECVGLCREDTHRGRQQAQDLRHKQEAIKKLQSKVGPDLLWGVGVLFRTAPLQERSLGGRPSKTLLCGHHELTNSLRKPRMFSQKKPPCFSCSCDSCTCVFSPVPGTQPEPVGGNYLYYNYHYALSCLTSTHQGSWIFSLTTVNLTCRGRNT